MIFTRRPGGRCVALASVMYDDRELNVRQRTMRFDASVPPPPARRYALAAIFGFAALSLSEANIDYLVGALSPANVSRLFALDIPSARAHQRALDRSTVDLGDCLRDEEPRTAANWPPAYAAICGDLAAAAISPIALVRKVPNPPPMKPPFRPEAPSPQAMAKTIALPLKRPTREIAVTKIVRPPAPVAPPTCVVDEEGRSVFRGARGPRVLPRRIAPPDAVGKSEGVALHVPADCDVLSPVGAKVLFADEFKGYRGVVILELPGKRRLVVAGLGTLAVTRGGRVERGDVIGATSALGAPALASTFGAAGESLIFFDVRNERGGAEPVAWLTTGLSG